MNGRKVVRQMVREAYIHLSIAQLFNTLTL